MRRSAHSNSQETMVNNPPDVTIRRLDTVEETQVEGLADLLVDSVNDGASVGFMAPLAREKAVAFWRRVADGVAAGERAILIAEDGTGIIARSISSSRFGEPAASRRT